MKGAEMAADMVEAQVTLPQVGELIESNMRLVSALEGQTRALAPIPKKVEEYGSEIVEAVDKLGQGGGVVRSDGMTGGANSDALDIVGGDGSGGKIQKLKDLFSGEKSIENTTESLKGLKSGVDAVTDVLGGAGKGSGVVRGLSNAGKGLSSLVGVLEGTSASAGLVGLLGELAVGVGAVVAAVQLANVAMDNIQAARDVSISQTGKDSDLTLGAREWMDVQMRSTFSPLSEEDAQGMQQTLIANRAKFGTDEYSEGMAFATGARLNYGMDSAKAAKLYTDAVVNGTTSIQQLNKTLEHLSDVAENSNVTMSEMTEKYTQFAESLEKQWGGAGTEAASQIAEVVGSSEEFGFISGAVGNLASSSWGSAFSRKMDELGEDYSTGTAAAKAAYEMFLQGRADFGNPQAMRWLKAHALTEGGGNKSFINYLKDGEYDELREVLKVMAKKKKGSWTDLLENLAAVGVDTGKNATPDSIVDMFSGLAGNLANAKTESQENVGSEQEQDITGSDWTTAAEEASANPDIQTDSWGIAYSGSDWAQAQADNERMAKADEEYKNVSDWSNAEGWQYARLREHLGQRKMLGDNFQYLNAESQSALLRELGEAYEDAGGNERYKTIDNWLNMEKNSVSGLISKYTENFEGGMTDDRQREMVAHLEISFDGDIGQYLYVKDQEVKFKYDLNRGSGD